MTRYLIPLNQAAENESQTVDVLTLEGTKRKKRKQWRAYLKVRAGIIDFHECNRVARELGFEELVK